MRISFLCRGLVTRNVDTSVKYFHDNHFTLTPFWPALSRDFKPYKPNPGALLHICQRWSIMPQEAVMVGDSARDDVGFAELVLTCINNWSCYEANVPGKSAHPVVYCEFSVV